MNKNVLVSALLMASLLSACAEEKKTDGAASAKPSAAAPAKSGAGASSAKPKASAKPKKLDSAGLEKVADSVKFTQASEKEGTFTGKLENTSESNIGRLEYKAFAYGEDDKLIEMVAGKYPKKLEAGKGVDLEVGPFKKAAGKSGVTVEVVVSWMNVDGTSYQRPVPKDRTKGGPNNALKK